LATRTIKIVSRASHVHNFRVKVILPRPVEQRDGPNSMLNIQAVSGLSPYVMEALAWSFERYKEDYEYLANN
jgi:hypothetical protein